MVLQIISVKSSSSQYDPQWVQMPKGKAVFIKQMAQMSAAKYLVLKGPFNYETKVEGSSEGGLNARLERFAFGWVVASVIFWPLIVLFPLIMVKDEAKGRVNVKLFDHKGRLIKEFNEQGQSEYWLFGFDVFREKNKKKSWELYDELSQKVIVEMMKTIEKDQNKKP